MPSGKIVRDAEACLREWLANSGIGQGGELPSEREIGRRIGLSYYAVNRAMARLVSEGAVTRSGYRLSYWPEYVPKNRGPLAFDALFHVSPVLGRCYQTLIRDLNIPVRQNRWATIDDVNRILTELLAVETRGVVFQPPFTHPSSVWEPAIWKLLDKGIPCVCLGSTALDIPSVTGDRLLALDQTFTQLEEWKHSELALIPLSSGTRESYEMEEAWKRHCLHKRLLTSSERILPIDHLSRRQAAAQVVELLRGGWKEVTAIVVENMFVLPAVAEALALAGVKVPRDLSILAIGDPRIHHKGTLITSASFDADFEREMAFHLLERLARKKEDTGNLPRGERIRIAPTWIYRSSAGPRGSSFAATSSAGKRTPSTLQVLPRRGREELESMIRRAYSLTKDAPGSRFVSINLKPYLNRPTNYRRGWLGELPLGHLEPGECRIHGVPFQVCGGRKRTDNGALVFRSLNTAKGDSKPLPDSVRIRIGCEAQAIYVLHGCGYAQYLKQFALYRFLGGDRLIEEIPLRSFGYPPEHLPLSQWNVQAQNANIQDWWPDFPQFDFPTGRMAPIFGSDAENSTRYLYTLEWVNPKPEQTVEALEIRVDTSQSTTLGLLAVSVLKPGVKRSARK